MLRLIALSLSIFLTVSIAYGIDEEEAIRVARRGASQMGVEFGTPDQRRPVEQQDSGVWIVFTDKLFIMLTQSGKFYSIRHRTSPPEWEHERTGEGALTQEQIAAKAKEYAARMGSETSNLVLREFEDTRTIMQTVTLVPEIGGYRSVEGITVSLNRMNGSLISIGSGLVGRTFDPARVELTQRQAAERILEQVTADRPNAPKFTQREPLPTLSEIERGITLVYRTPSKNLGDRARRANQERRLRLCYDYSDSQFAISIDAENGDINDFGYFASGPRKEPGTSPSKTIITEPKSPVPFVPILAGGAAVIALAGFLLRKAKAAPT